MAAHHTEAATGTCSGWQGAGWGMPWGKGFSSAPASLPATANLPRLCGLYDKSSGERLDQSQLALSRRLQLSDTKLGRPAAAKPCLNEARKTLSLQVLPAPKLSHTPCTLQNYLTWEKMYQSESRNPSHPCICIYTRYSVYIDTSREAEMHLCVCTQQRHI